MRFNSVSTTGLLVLSILSTPNVFATGDLTAQTAISVTVKLGNTDNALRFFPQSLQFETGKLYKLIIHNPSRQKHYFTSPGLANAVFTRKVQIVDHLQRNIAEVKGHINEIEVYPGGTAQWWFVPVKTLQSSTLHCTIKDHTESGMKGDITIK